MMMTTTTTGTGRTDRDGAGRRAGVLRLSVVAWLLVLSGCMPQREDVLTLATPEGVRLLALDVSNFRGNVVVRADKPAQDVTVTARVRVDPGRDVQDRAAYAELVDVDAEIEAGEGGRGVVRVRTTSPAAWDAAHRAHLYITMPRCDGVRIDSRGGYVEVAGAGGAAEITNLGGSIEYRTDRVNDAPLTFTTSDGDIWLQLPLGSSGAFDLETLDGEVAFRDASGEAGRTYSLRDRMTTTLGDAEHEVLARTSNGNIRVWVMEEPLELRRAYWREPKNPLDGAMLFGPRRFRRNLPDDHPEVFEIPVKDHYDPSFR